MRGTCDPRRTRIARVPRAELNDRVRSNEAVEQLRVRADEAEARLTHLREETEHRIEGSSRGGRGEAPLHLQCTSSRTPESHESSRLLCLRWPFAPSSAGGRPAPAHPLPLPSGRLD